MCFRIFVYAEDGNDDECYIDGYNHIRGGFVLMMRGHRSVKRRVYGDKYEDKQANPIVEMK